MVKRVASVVPGKTRLDVVGVNTSPRMAAVTIAAVTLPFDAPIDLAAHLRAMAAGLPDLSWGPGLDRPLTLEADVRRVDQVLTNLLSNAVKYNRDGGMFCRLLAVD